MGRLRRQWRGAGDAKVNSVLGKCCGRTCKPSGGWAECRAGASNARMKTAATVSVATPSRVQDKQEQAMPMSFRSLPGGARPLALAALSLAVAGALALPQAANASAFQLKENSAKGMGRAYAGSATAGGDASVVANNPAAMTDLDGTYLQADVTAINFSAKFSGTAHDALGRPISGGNGGDAGTTLPVPALFIASKVSDRVHLGFGLSVPFGFQTEYDSNWIGRYHAIKSRFESLDATLSGSFD